jgi:CheY-like chemotaxis protein
MDAKRILIVEDEAIAALNMKLALTDLGHEVINIVVTGEDAIEVSSRKTPDLVLMDIVLAGEMDGIEAAERIVKQFKVPILYVTAHTDTGTVERAMKTNPAGFMEKPVEDDQWNDILKTIFGSP